MKRLIQIGILLHVLLLCSGSSSGKDINGKSMLSIRGNMKESVSPCRDFWTYACGNWANVASNEHYRDNFELVEHNYAKAMEVILSGIELSSKETAPHLVQQMRDYYSACSKVNVFYPRMELYLLNLPAELQISRELFTSQSSGETENFDWARSAANLRKYGLNGIFFDEAVDVAFNDSLLHVVQLKIPEQLNYFSNPSILLSYMLEFGLIDHIDTFAQQQAQQIYALELQLSQLGARHSNNANEQSAVESWTLMELKQQIPQIAWRRYFNVLLETKAASLDLRFEVINAAYLRELGALLQRSNQRTLNLYLWMRLCHFLIQARPRELKPAACVHHMRALLPLGMNYIYDHYVYQTRTQDEPILQQIFSSLRNTFAKYLQANKMQLTPPQLSYVQQKLQAIQLKLGNLPTETSPLFYDAHYASANFTDTNFFHNHWQALRLRVYLQHAPLLQPGAAVQLERYYYNDDVGKGYTAPFFEYERNVLTLPLIFLQLPFFDHRQHAVFQYSLVGFILAHELSHAFEEKGMLLDAAGNETPLGMQICELPQFQAALQCVQQSPTASVRERLADFNGLQVAYDAFFGIGHASEQFEYRPYAFEAQLRAPQLFYLNFAQFFCGTLPQPIGHDADNVRVNLSVKNVRQFGSDFNCTSNETLEPCEMWRFFGAV